MDRESWNQRYAAEELVWSAAPNRFLVAEVEELPPGRALDLAAGEGRNALWLAERGWQVDAVDFSDVAVEKARRLEAHRGVSVSWALADLTDYRPAEGAYHLVLVLYLHLPWDELAPVLERAVAAVRPGGTFLAIGHDRANLEEGHGGPRDPGVLYTADQLAPLLSGLDVQKAARMVRTLPVEGGEARAIDCLVRAVRPEVPAEH